MSKLPQLNLRIPEDHHELIRQIAVRLREAGGETLAARLAAVLTDTPPPAVADLGDLAARVAELEQWRQSFSAPEPAPVPERPKGEYIPEEICSKANALKRKGMTWEAVWKELGEPATVNGLRNAVGKWRKRYRVQGDA